MAYAKFTFFEAATQHGYVMALMGEKITKSREFHQIIVDPSRGRVFQLFKTSRPETPFFEYIIPERLTTESTFMWRARVKKGVDAAWKDIKTKPAPTAVASGKDGTGASASPPLSPGALSTGVPPKSELSSGTSVAAEPVTPGSVPGPSTPVSSPTGKASLPDSASPSRKSGSKSQSSSGGSTASSGSGTGPPESTPAKD